jgi:hypothetical protein
MLALGMRPRTVTVLDMRACARLFCREVRSANPNFLLMTS